MIKKISILFFSFILAAWGAGCKDLEMDVASFSRAGDGDRVELDLEIDGGGPDGDTDAHEYIPGNYLFTPDSPIPNKGRIVLTNPKLDGRRLTLDVMINGVGGLMGLAFRLIFDPQILGYDGFEQGDALGPGAVSQCADPVPGQIWVGATNINDMTVDVLEPGLVCRVSFSVLKNGVSDIVFDPNPWRSIAADGDMNRLAVSFHGGTFGPPRD